jgi:hypothetical protein
MGKPPPGRNDPADPLAGTSATQHGAECPSDGTQNHAIPASASATNRVLSFAPPKSESDVHRLTDDGEHPPLISQIRSSEDDRENQPLSFLEDGLGAARGIGAAIMFVGAFLLMALFVLWISSKMGIVP